jgi:prepilin-type N-terminal cleavage/methylation domain-containing protein
MRKNDGFTLIELMIVVAIIAIVAAIAIPSLLAARRSGNEAAALGALKTIASAQSMYREGDKDGDGSLDYGSLAQLASVELIDSVLGAGTKQGYSFATNADLDGEGAATGIVADPSNLFVALAIPTVARTTGDRLFYTDQSGGLFAAPTGTLLTPGAPSQANAGEAISLVRVQNGQWCDGLAQRGFRARYTPVGK